MDINTNEIAKDLREGLSPEFLEDAVRDYGYKVLNDQIIHLIGSNAANDYAYLVKVAGEALSANNDSDATKIEFAEIECAHTRKQLESVVTAFGARAFFHAAVQVHEEKVDDILASNLRDVLRQTSLKELYSWFTSAFDGANGRYGLAIDLDKVTNDNTRDLIVKLSELYGGRMVALRIEGLLDAQITDRLKLFIDGETTPLDRVKAFTAARMALSSRGVN